MQLSDIARPGILLQTLVNFVGDLNVRGVVGAELADKMVGQRPQILAPVPQGRQLHRNHMDPIKEISANPTGPDQLLHVAAGGSDNPHIGLAGLPAAHRAKTVALQDSQKFDLHGQTDLADLVQKEGAAVGPVKVALPVTVGSGEGPPTVAEKFTFGQSLGNGPAVDGDKILLRPFAEIVDGAGHHLLAGAGLSVDNHVGAGPRRLGQHIVHPLHHRAVAHQQAEADIIADKLRLLEVFQGENIALALGRSQHGQHSPGEVMEGLHRPHQLPLLIVNRGGHKVEMEGLAAHLEPVEGLPGVGNHLGLARVFPLIEGEEAVEVVFQDQIGHNGPFPVIERFPVAVGADHLNGLEAGEGLAGLVPVGYFVVQPHCELGQRRTVEQLIHGFPPTKTGRLLMERLRP